jgi:hypothetical protein
MKLNYLKYKEYKSDHLLQAIHVVYPYGFFLFLFCLHFSKLHF